MINIMALAGLRYLLACVLLFTSLSHLVAADIASDSHVESFGGSGNLSLAVNVPKNDTNTLYFHFTAPAGQSWAAFGIGSAMKGSLIFVVYGAEDKINITLSPRLGSGHSLPQFTDQVQTTVLPGSQIADGYFVVNAKCTGCRSWTGGSLNINSTAQNFIYAVGPSSTDFVSNDVKVGIQQHSDGAYGGFTLNMQKATGDAGVPVVASSSGTGTGSTPAPAGQSDFPIALHALLFIAAFLVVFPGGYLFLRVFEKVWIHAGFQSVGLLLVIGGTVSGIILSVKRDLNPKMNSVHQGLGLAIFGLVVTAWILGLVGHQIYKRTQMPAIPMKIHRGVGPAAIFLGLMNVGFGFNFADKKRHIIPFYVLTLLMIIFVSGMLFMVKKRKMRKAAMTTPAAQNFQQAYYPGPEPPPKYATATASEYYAPRTQDVPLQTFGTSYQQHAPPSMMHPGNRIH